MSSTPHSTVISGSIGRTGSPSTLRSWRRWRSGWAGSSRLARFWELVAFREPTNPAARLGTGPPRHSERRRGRRRPRGSWRPLSAELGLVTAAGTSARRRPATTRSRFPDSRTVREPRGSPISSRTMASRPSINSPRCQAAASACSISTATASSTFTACRGAVSPATGRVVPGRSAVPQSGRRHVRGQVSRQPGSARCRAAMATASPWATTTTTVIPTCFLTRWRSYALYRNRGDGTFEDRTAQGRARRRPRLADLGGLRRPGQRRRPRPLCLPLWRRGTLGIPRSARIPSGTIVITCDPRVIESLPDHVFRNDAGRFVDVTGRGRASSIAMAGAWASSPRTWTATTGSTSSSPTTARRTSSSAIWEAFDSRRSDIRAGVAANAAGWLSGGHGRGVRRSRWRRAARPGGHQLLRRVDDVLP